jgi:2-amino-4-hydroxy-6-hydroxymethyldihydropteridine diphosphokinase
VDGRSDERVAYVGLGSNLGERRGHLEAALAALRATPGISEVRVSSLYETEPVGPPQGRYLNAAARLRTGLPARRLLERLQAIERAAGRVRGPERNGPRSLDLDLLLYGDSRIREPDLVVPHPRLCERAFALEPLAELAPDLRHPDSGLRIDELARRVRDPGAVRRLPPVAAQPFPAR